MSLRQPPLYAIHEQSGASFTDFGGWNMPVEFDGIRQEHRAVREDVGVFDVSHMGQFRISGPEAAELNNRLFTNNTIGLDVGTGTYGAVLREDGIMLEDLIIYRLPDDNETPQFLAVPNVGNDGDMVNRWRRYRDQWDLDADIDRETDQWAMIAVQGPDASTAVQAATDDDVASLNRFRARWTTIDDLDVWTARTGYTGEDGFELLASAEHAEQLWEPFANLQPCGLGARDTLRIEAGFLLSGQDFHPEEQPVTPIEAGIEFAVDFETEFVGREACIEQQSSGPERRFTGLKLRDRGVPRHGYPITSPEGDTIGEITSGTMAPTLDEPIGLGYVNTAYAEPGTAVRVMVRDRPKDAVISSSRFLEQ